MSQDTNADAGDAPDGEDRFRGPRKRVPSLPGPREDASPAVLGPPSPTVREDEGTRVPRAELSVSPQRLYVTVEIPGASKDSIELAATDRRLTVHAPRTDAAAYHLEIDLPVRVDAGSAKATYRNGVLDVTLSREDGRGGAENEG